MYSTRKNLKSLLIIFFVCLSLTICTGFIDLQSASKLTANANNSALTFTKVSTNIDIDANGRISEIKYGKENGFKTIETINNEDFVLLNNTEARDNVLSKIHSPLSTTNNILTEGIDIQFGVDNEIRMIYITATLNGRKIALNKFESNKDIFRQTIFGLPYELAYTTQTEKIIPIANPEGEFEFRYKYNPVNEGMIGKPVSGSFKFRLISQRNYDITQIEGKDISSNYIYNTFTTDGDTNNFIKSTTTTEKHLFNYNNFNTSTEIKNLNTLQFPTVKYDATKYLLSWNKKFKNNTIKVESNLNLLENNKARVDYITTFGDASENFSIDIEDIKLNPFIEIEFSEIGLYEFDFKYMVLNSNSTYVTSTNLDPLTKTLELFGYQLKYAKDKTGSEELVSEENNLYGDITFINKAFINQDPSMEENRPFGDLNFFNVNDGNPYSYIPKTNQAPLWFDFWGNLIPNTNNAHSNIYFIKNTANLNLAQSITDFNSAIKKSEIKTLQYNKNDYFSEAGLYVAEINYQNKQFANNIFTQIFAFEITNTAPDVQLIGLEKDGTTHLLNNEQFTNLSVNIDWKIESPFNAEIYATYTLCDYNYVEQSNFVDVPFNAVNSGIATTLSKNGVYIIKVYYTNSHYTYSTYTLTIDKSPISNISYFIHKSGETGYKVNVSESINQNPILNENFVINYDNKKSNAKITCEYQSILIIEDENYVRNSIDNIIKENENTWLVKNGWKTSDVSSKLNCIKNKTVFSTQAIYLFHIFDEAGNEAYSYIILDKTNPMLIFNPEINNNYNIIDKDTSVITGSHKAITLNFNKNNIEFEYFKNEENFNANLFDFEKNCLTVKLSKKSYTEGKTFNDAYHNTNFINIKNKIELTIPSDLDEYHYVIRIEDISRINDRINIINESTTGKITSAIEYNLDHSQVKAKAKATNESISPNKGIRIYNASATNQDMLYIEYYGNKDGYIVEKLYYDFYPLTLDKSSKNYPYAETPSIKKQNILVEGAMPGTPLTTVILNPIMSQALARQVTAEGMYVITRIYEKNDKFIDEDISKRTKTYTFLVDRVKPIDEIELSFPIDSEQLEFKRKIGEFIKLILGSENHIVEYKDFLNSSQNANQVILSTDLLPIKSMIPYNKYILLDEKNNILENINLAKLISYNLNIQIFYTKPSGGQSIIIANETTKNDNNFLNLSKVDFRKIGRYTFILSDNSGYTQNENGETKINCNPNSFTFVIEVKKEFPNAEFYGTPNKNGTDKIIHNITSGAISSAPSTRDSDLKLVFYDSINPYKARINYTDVLIARKTKNASFFENAIKIHFEDLDESGVTEYKKSTDMTNLNQVIGIREKMRNENNEVITDKYGNIIYKYTIVLPTQTKSGILYEGEYKATIHYYGDKKDYWNNIGCENESSSGAISYYQNLDNQLRIVLDHTAPNFNLIRLVNEDRFIPTTSTDVNEITKSDIYSYAKGELKNKEKKEAVRQFLRTYSFAMNQNFVFRSATNDGFPIENNFMSYDYANHDTNMIFFRKYDKYTNKDNSEQSYINSDPEYNDITKQRFEIANPKYTPYNYAPTSSSESFAEFCKNKNYGDGYYEIIEIDQAGNQTIYTIYINTKTTTLNFSNKNTSYEVDAQSKPLSIDYNTVLKSIDNLDVWTILEIYDNSSNQNTKLKTFKIVYDTDLNKIINEINGFISFKEYYAKSGAQYKIHILNRFSNEQNDLNIFIQRPGNKLEHTITEGEISFELRLPADTPSTWITSFEIYRYNPKTNSLNLLTKDLNKEISKTEFNNVVYNFSIGEYYFYLIDNFDRGQKEPIHYIFGIEDKKDLEFSGKVEYKENIPITASETYFYFQEVLYEIEIERNGNKIDWLNDNLISLETNLINQIKKLTFKKCNNDLYEYKIIAKQKTGKIGIESKPYILEFTMDTRLPAFILQDKNGNDMNYLLESNDSSTSKKIFISWAEDQDYPVKVSLTYNHNGTIQIINLKKGDSIFMEGEYILTMTNSLENTVSYKFNISQIYSILYDVNTNGKKIKPSVLSQEFVISNVNFNGNTLDIAQHMKVYTSIYDFKVTTNEQKDLQVKLVFEISPNESYTLQIYKIFGYTSLYYEEYIALIKLNPENLILDGFIIGENENILTNAEGSQSTFYNSNVYFKYNRFLEMDVEYATENLFIENFIYLELQYNNIKVDNYFDKDLFMLTESGNYKLSFRDIAGKEYVFNTLTNTSKFYTINLYNNISYLINDNEPIQNATFNDAVTLKINNLNIYTPNSFSILITHNGSVVDQSKYSTKNGWIFSDYGIWQIKLSAKYNGVKVNSDYSFDILSNKEARKNYSFAKKTNYEIVEVYKDTENNSILNELKKKYHTDKLTELYLSTANNDFGHYTIKVKVESNAFKPTLYYTFSFWLNEFDVDVIPSIPFGNATINPITIKLNYYAIHKELGNFVVKISGYNPININSENAGANKVSEIQLTKNQTYFVQLWSESGSLIKSYKITKLEPLNTVSIIMIVVGSLVVIGLIIMFIILRKRMKVR